MDWDEEEALPQKFIDLIQATGDTDQNYFEFIHDLLREGEIGPAVDFLALHASNNGIIVPDELVATYARFCNEADMDREFEEFLAKQEKLRAKAAQ